MASTSTDSSLDASKTSLGSASSPRISIRRRMTDAGFDSSYEDDRDANGLPIHRTRSGRSGRSGGSGRSSNSRTWCCFSYSSALLYLALVAIGSLTLGLYIGMFFFTIDPSKSTLMSSQDVQSRQPSSLNVLLPNSNATQAHLDKKTIAKLRDLEATIKVQQEIVEKLKQELAVRTPHRVSGSSISDADKQSVKHEFKHAGGQSEKIATNPEETGATVKTAIHSGKSSHEKQLNTHQQIIDHTLNTNSSTKSASHLKSNNMDISKAFRWKILPSSSVWCYGTERANRVCRIRNLCYHPKQEDWFILKTNRSVLHNVPNQPVSEPLLETGTVQDHSYFFWNYVEASPFDASLQNMVVRFEDTPHFIFKRLHPKNIMHNLHDDVIGMYFMMKEFIGRGRSSHYMPFSLDGHRVLIIDPYGATESTRPFQYLSNLPLRFGTYLKQKGEEDVVTCFRDAYVGNTKLTTWYQYGFDEPQGPILNKSPNGMYIREVTEWFIRRLALPLGSDEDYSVKMSTSVPDRILSGKELDFPESDIIVILSRKGNRLILNELQLAEDLKKAFGYEVVFVRNEDHTFEEQIVLLRRARVVIGMHGSILVMVMFCRRGTVVVEMYPFAVPGDHYTPYKTLSNLNGMDLVYRSWENKDPKKAIPHPTNHRLNGGIDTLPLSEQLLIINTLTVPQHKCCSSPYWFYRIYQDTEVSSFEVIPIIEEALVESRKVLARIRSTNTDEVQVQPAIIKVIRCLEHKNRPPGTLWMAWDAPWNGVKVDKWNVHTMNDGHDYVTMGSEPTISIPNLQPNSTIRVFIRPVMGTVRGSWSQRGECVV
ncbi:hypothetical protein BASA50_002448 [Batrachochytrium salamandrivorans]|uniref:Glycosyltransferase 61 catalytic domain-containing protein n=1 Tax=Batrachochytrium salamandrivorans TaxID=1357716 RepID=A0ABQ8FLC2_9FUNG|nr:hypothetical protein BASA50_002448 [Batrachochytrium salamandrivorans]KAH9246151.1 hypothetical protein BASA81_016319 [Batrachochytrium salamandrivorans]KAH9269912.1 hypothetical protein BASA83_008067 [Batrachochytrium salamandrivorans]